MDEHLFLKGQRVISPQGEGEVIDAIGDKIVVKLDNGKTETFPSGDLEDNNSAGWSTYLNSYEKKFDSGRHPIDGDLIQQLLGYCGDFPGRRGRGHYRRSNCDRDHHLDHFFIPRKK